MHSKDITVVIVLAMYTVIYMIVYYQEFIIKIVRENV